MGFELCAFKLQSCFSEFFSCLDKKQNFLLLSSAPRSAQSEIWPSTTVTAHRWLWQSLTDGLICGTPPPLITATQMVQSTSCVSDWGAITKPITTSSQDGAHTSQKVSKVGESHLRRGPGWQIHNDEGGGAKMANVLTEQNTNTKSPQWRSGEASNTKS